MTGVGGDHHGAERIDRVRTAIRREGLDGIICQLPSNVLMLSGYWPVVGTAFAVATADGQVAVLAPEDERDLADAGWAAAVETYSPLSMNDLAGPAEHVRKPLSDLLERLRLTGGTVGFEDTTLFEEATYAASFVYGQMLLPTLQAAASGRLVPMAAVMTSLRSRLTRYEVSKVGDACKVAGIAFRNASRAICPGLREPEVADAFQSRMVVDGLASEDVRRAGSFTFCMSGPNAALAGGAYARTRNRKLEREDLVLVHCNSYLDGYWTDITRTYYLGRPDERTRSVYDAILEARSAALEVIAPGARASEVDRAARDVLDKHGLGRYFTHGIGHNVGFSAISPDFPPRLSPVSPDVLTEGMTFNVEPAAYIEGWGGVRHCDVVTVRPNGPEVLTPFEASIEDLVLGP
ncbi:MAG TPA: Xaa-Pro peptidase family protein [Chloroflexota bacterium]|nr:Xaa-Pro peptidase family protein [Chloroflexota bacterium]